MAEAADAFQSERHFESLKETSNPKTQVPKTGTWGTPTPLSGISAESAAVILFARFRGQGKNRLLTAGRPSVSLTLAPENIKLT